ncbi:MAG TPA: hypothetical protein VL069_14885, partial [Opitutus sp.]|nr:hypothetical protein [Opitutus sp.]
MSGQTSTPAVTALALLNGVTQQPLRGLSDGSTIDLALDGEQLNIAAETIGTLESVSFSWNGVLFSTDNTAPYAMMASGSAWTPTAGTHTLRVTPFARLNGKGAPGTAMQITVNVSGPTTPLPPPPPPEPEPEPEPAPLSVTRFTLINAATQQDIRVLNTGDTIDLVKDGAVLNVRAEIAGTAGSVRLFLDGNVFNVDNTSPFCIGGDTSGVYAAWTPSVGSHTLRAVPFASADGTGTSGTALEIAFSVTHSLPTLGNWDLGTGLPLYDANGALNLPLYDLLALSYDKSTMELRFGPSFSDLSPNAPENRPTLFKPTSKANSLSYIRVNPYELGSPVKDNDYWSDTGQVAYVPDVVTDPGLDRIQTYAYYDHVFAISPRLDRGSAKAHP